MINDGDYMTDEKTQQPLGVASDLNAELDIDEVLFLNELKCLFFTALNIFTNNLNFQLIFRDFILDWLYIDWVKSLKAGDSYISHILYTSKGCVFTTTKIDRVSDYSLWCGEDRYRRSDGKLIGGIYKKLCMPIKDEYIEFAKYQNLKIGI